MAETDAQTRMAEAKNALRDSAKWMVGGVVATAATVFTGSSLTHFGSLTLEETPLRLFAALCALAIGFLGLAFILFPAIRLLTIDVITFRILAANPDLAGLRSTMEQRYPSRPFGNATIAQLAHTYDTTPNAALRAEIARFAAIVTADACFQMVREKFDTLVRWLKIGSAFAIVGFGTFAWAANPPDPKPAPKPTSATTVSITVTPPPAREKTDGEDPPSS